MSIRGQHYPSSMKCEGVIIVQPPEEVDEMQRLVAQGWGSKRIAQEIGCSRNTVKRYLRQGGWKPYAAPRRNHKLEGLEEWLSGRFKQHQGNADVIRQELATELRLRVSLRTVERAVAHLRNELFVQSKATVRFETPPGQQLQIDFGSKTVTIGGEKVRVFVFVATLGYSRRLYAEAFSHERQSAWFQGLEGAFRHFGGVTKQVLVDNAAALVKMHNRETGEIIFNERFHDLCRYYRVTPKACAPYRARTKGKDERGVGYVKNNALAGRTFASWDELDAHLRRWNREIADLRTHGTTGEAPLDRFERDERNALAPTEGKAPFQQIQEVVRHVAKDSFVDFDTNRYSVPWKLIGERLSVSVCDLTVAIFHAGKQVAEHPRNSGRRVLVRDPAHFKGIFQTASRELGTECQPPPDGELQRSLAVYERVAGGAW